MRTDLHRRLLLALIVVLACSRTPAPALSQTPPSADASLGKLVAPIALYPDPLVAQILPASTQPVQVVEAARAVAAGARPDQDTASQWDPSVQALLSFPTVLKMMNDKLEWTTRLGQAVVANQGAVMAAIQQVRQQAQAAGNLQSNAQQAVQTQGSTIVIEPANPQYIYVPQYDPVAILAPAPYYAYAAPLMTFGVGFAAGAATAYACDWGRYGGYGSITVNNNYHYNYSNSYETYHSGTGSYTRYEPATGSSATYHSATGTYSGYDARTGTYGAYNPSTGKYGTYNPSTGAYDKSGSTGTYHPPSSSGSDSHGAAPEGDWGGRSNWGSDGGSGGDAFHGLGGGGWGARDASNRGFDSGGGRNFGGEGFGGAGFGGGFDRGGGGFGGGGFGGFRGGGFGGRR